MRRTTRSASSTSVTSPLPLLPSPRKDRSADCSAAPPPAARRSSWTGRVHVAAATATCARAATAPTSRRTANGRRPHLARAGTTHDGAAEMTERSHRLETRARPSLPTGLMLTDDLLRIAVIAGDLVNTLNPRTGKDVLRDADVLNYVVSDH